MLPVGGEWKGVELWWMGLRSGFDILPALKDGGALEIHSGTSAEAHPLHRGTKRVHYM